MSRLSYSGDVKLVRKFNLLRIPPLPSDLMNGIHDYLSFVMIKHTRNKNDERTEYINCYDVLDMGGQLFTICGAGALEHIMEMIAATGMHPLLVDRVRPAKRIRENLQIDMSRFKKVLPNPRDWQLEFVKMIHNFRCGQVKVSTGAGKSTAIVATAFALPRARILYTVPSREALKQQYEKMRMYIPETEFVKSGGRFKGSRVVCCTTGMLEGITAQNHIFDITFVDEQHMTCTASQMAKIISIKSHKIFAVSANYHDRMDRGDKWSDIVYGPLRLTRTYQQNVEAKDVSPVEVRWRSCKHIKDEELRSKYMRDRFGITYCNGRNLLVFEDARRHRDDQVLIITRTTEHALLLANELQCPAVYGSMSPEREEQLRSLDLILPGDKPLTKQGRDDLRHAFASGAIKLAVATSVWNQAVDFPRLNVLIRADAASSSNKCTQICGRPGRIYEHKQKAIIYDYEDQHNEHMKNNAYARRAFYKSQNFTQVKFDD